MARSLLLVKGLVRLAERFWGNIRKQWADRLGVGGPPSFLPLERTPKQRPHGFNDQFNSMSSGLAYMHHAYWGHRAV